MCTQDSGIPLLYHQTISDHRRLGVIQRWHCRVLRGYRRAGFRDASHTKLSSRKKTPYFRLDAATSLAQRHSQPTIAFLRVECHSLSMTTAARESSVRCVNAAGRLQPSLTRRAVPDLRGKSCLGFCGSIPLALREGLVLLTEAVKSERQVPQASDSQARWRT